MPLFNIANNNNYYCYNTKYYNVLLFTEPGDMYHFISMPSASSIPSKVIPLPSYQTVCLVL